MDNLEVRDFIILMFQSYQRRKQEGRLYDKHNFIPQNIIEAYYTSGTPHFDQIYYNFKHKYVYHESRVESNKVVEYGSNDKVQILDDETKGLGKVYDYITKYNFKKGNFNIFVDAIRIHQLLYSECKDPSFGGKLRDQNAYLYDMGIDVMDPNDAREYFQMFIGLTPELMHQLDKANIFDYINTCVYITTELIKAQPFANGNKRTFRSLLNMMFKYRNLPPVYVTTNERDEYKEALTKAIKEEDYKSLNKFYYYKICDAIYELDIMPEIRAQKEKEEQELKDKEARQQVQAMMDKFMEPKVLKLTTYSHQHLPKY